MLKDVMGDGGRSLFFLILAMACGWIILDLFYGNKIIVVLVDKIFDGGNEPTTPLTDRELERKKAGVATGK